jgi:hypothetical protein
MDRRILMRRIWLLFFTIMINSLQASELIESSLTILEECMDEHIYVPRIFNQRLNEFLIDVTLNDLIQCLVKAEELGNAYVINGIAAVIVDRLDLEPEEILVQLQNRVTPQTYAFINKYIAIKNHKKITRACSPGTELSIADYVSIYDVPLEYLGNVGILRFDNKNITSLYGMQDISLSDVGIIILTNNCIVGNTLDPQFPDDPFQGLSNAYTFLINKNRIESLPVTFFQSTPLVREVNLAQNQLQSVPTAFANRLDQLGLLRLSSNKISSIAPSDILFAPILEILYLDNNLLQDLPIHFFEKIPEVNTLSLSKNRLSSWPGSVIESLVDPIYLDLANNSLVDFNPGFIAPGSQVILTGNALTASQIETIKLNYPDAYFIF